MFCWCLDINLNYYGQFENSKTSPYNSHLIHGKMVLLQNFSGIYDLINIAHVPLAPFQVCG